MTPLPKRRHSTRRQGKRRAEAGKAKQIAFADHDLGVAVDNLTREDYYKLMGMLQYAYA